MDESGEAKPDRSWRAANRNDRAALWSEHFEGNDRFAAFMADISGEDEVGCIVRAATYVEYYLEQIITRHLMHPSEVVWPSLTFQRRLELALAMGDLKLAMKGPLRMLARARNRIAHNPGAQLEVDDLRRIVDAFDGPMREQFDGYARIAEKAPGEMTDLIAALMVIEQNLVDGGRTQCDKVDSRSEQQDERNRDTPLSRRRVSSRRRSAT